MTDTQVVRDADGNVISDPPPVISAEPKPDDYVAYETHRRLLGEKKKMQADLAEATAKLAALDADREAAKAKELEEQGRFKELLDAETEKRAKLEAELNTFSKERQDMFKLSAFSEALDGQVEKPYWDMLAPIVSQRVKMDEQGNIDEMSVTETVKFIKDTYPAFITTTATRTGLPTSAPQGSSGGSLTHAEWRNLPLDEMKKRMKDVIKE